jgi:hypothetical protein
MSSHYAGLDFAVNERRLDLWRVKQRAEQRLRAAHSVDEAHSAFRRFLNAFGDAHLAIDWKPDAGVASRGDGGAKTAGLCTRLGYEDHDRGGVDFTLAPGYTPVADADSKDFSGGFFALAGGKLGIVRIDLFMEKMHPALCEAARSSLGLPDDAACDDECSDKLEVAVADRLTAALERRLRSLAKGGAQAIAVDITGNGGGSNWVDAAVRVVTPAKLDVRPMGAVRHPHWVKQLGDRIHGLEQDLAAHGDVEHGAIAAGLVKLRAALAQVQTPCDETALWIEGQPKPTCTQLVMVPPLIAYAKPGALVGRTGASALFGPSQYVYDEGVNTLPLAVLVDGGTGSAAEDFAATLQDHHAATILGAETVGAGCGYTNGGIPTVLPHSGARVSMPDCVRTRADGSNAVAGVTPDVVLPLLDRDSPYQRTRKVTEGLAAAWKRIVGLKPRGASP